MTPDDPLAPRPGSPPPRRAGAPQQNPANAANLALHGQLIDAAASPRGETDPLAHLEARPSAPSPVNTVPLSPRRNAPPGDDELADLFNDPASDDTPSLLGPARQLPNDPLALLQRQQSAGFEQPPAMSAIQPAVRPPAARAVPQEPINQPLQAIPPATPQANPPAAIIPDDWDPGLGTVRREPVFAPRPAPPPTARLLPLPRRQREEPAPGEAADLQSLMQSGAEPQDDGVDNALTLLRRREAARGASSGEAGLTEISDIAEIEAAHLTAARVAPFAAERKVAAAPTPVPAAPDALEVLWQALGVDPSRVSEPDQRRLLTEIGQTVREMADGLIQILAARQHLKSEFRVDRTVLRPTENNLFKFTRNADELLSLAMTNRNRVFLPMNQAAREALNDIKAHELATLAAVQLSIRAVVDRFQPEKLARQAAHEPSGRFGWLKLRSVKEKCWDFFTKMYANLAADADEASNRIFSAEFGRAYREQVEKRRVR